MEQTKSIAKTNNALRPSGSAMPDDPDIFDRNEISAFSRVHDLNQHLTIKQQPRGTHASRVHSMVLDSGKVPETRWYLEDPHARRLVMEPDDSRGMRAPRISRPRPQVHNNAGLRPRDERSAAVMNSNKTR
jgi:hypothetical protein